MSSVSIVLLNWNGRHFLERFLPGVVQFSPGCNIIVVDNHSSDGSVNFVAKHYPQIRLISHKSNLGFCRGYNKALKQIDSDFYVLLNTDVEVTEGWLQPIQFMEKDKSIAACQPKILSWHDKKRFEYAGAAGGFLDKYGYPFCRGRIFDILENDHGQYDNTLQVFWASGACFFIRAALFHKFNGFDERFFAHMEEIDLCWKLNNAGYKIFCYPKSTVYHVGGGALPQGNPAKTYLNFRNNLLMMTNNLSKSDFRQVIVARMLLDYIAFLMFILTGRFKNAVEIPKAHRSFLSLRKMKSDNKQEITAGISSKILYRSLILFDYYFKRRREFKKLKF